MPVARFQMPDGRIARFEVPEGTSPEQAQAMIRQHLASSVPAPAPAPAPDPAPPQPQQSGNLWKTVRPYVAPLLEVGGAAAGGVAGAGMTGPFAAAGAPLGAGLGYGMAREVLNRADVAFGNEKPRQGLENVTEPLSNVAWGAMGDAAGRGFASWVQNKFTPKSADEILGARLIKERLAESAANKLSPQEQVIKNRLAEQVVEETPSFFGKFSDTKKAVSIARQAAGKDLNEIVSALKNAGPDVTPAQATSHISNPLWQKFLKESTPSRTAEITMALQEDAAKAALSKAAGGATKADIWDSLRANKDALKATTTPMREAVFEKGNALSREFVELENLAKSAGKDAMDEVAKVRRLMELGETANAAARMQMIKQNLPVGAARYTYTADLARMADKWADTAARESLEAGAKARSAQEIIDTLSAAGVKPARADDLVNEIRKIGSRKEFAANDVIEHATNNIIRQVKKWSTDGIVDLEALDAIRKNAVDAAIAAKRQGFDASSQAKLASSVLTKIKDPFNQAIEAAGGKGWSEYLNTHREGMEQIARQRLLGDAFELWKNKETRGQFVRLVNEESPDVVEKILGPGKYKIAREFLKKEVSDSQKEALAVLQKEADRVMRTVAADDQASRGARDLAELIKANASKFKIPNALQFWVTATNKGLDELQNEVGEKAMKILRQNLESPKQVANLLQGLPVKEQARIMSLIENPTFAKSAKAAAAATAGAAGPDALGEVKNSLSSKGTQNKLVR